MKTYGTLIEAAELRAAPGTAGGDSMALAIVDCRFELSRPKAGREAYERGHIPGAVYAHLDEDLSGPVTPSSGRHPLPDVATFAKRLSDWGIGADTQVIAYDEANGAFAARLWWLLRWLGHPKVAVLDGGFKQWERAGYPIETGAASTRKLQPGGKQFHPRMQANAWLTTPEVERDLARGDILLVDARPADRFAGLNETIDPVAGHIPGACNHPVAANLDAEQRFLPAEALRERWSKTLAGKPASQTVCMCGSGVTACHNLLALEIAGLPGARLYAGSWSEWIRDPKRPVTR